MTKENSIRLSKSSQTKFNRIDLNFPKTGRVGIHGLNEEEIAFIEAMIQPMGGDE